uniref:Putative terminase n=1 Tax=viral metagenome TaxID=1070528 RepID=A0A6M3IIC7_9ZZZZ
MSGDTLVILADGSTKRVDEIDIGDMVVTGGGEFACVKKKFITGEKEVYGVGTWLSSEKIYASLGHKFFTEEGIKECWQLTLNDWIQVPRIPIKNSIDKYNFRLEKNGRGTELGGGAKCDIEEAEISLDRGFGYYIGYYLAEGCVKTRENGDPCYVHFAYHKDEVFIDKAYEWFAREYCTSRNDFEDETNRKRTYLYGKFLASLTERICGRTDNKRIPHWFFDSNRDFLRGILEGYFDGDGNKDFEERRSLGAVCIREKISRQIKRIIISLGYGVSALTYMEERYRYDVKTKPIYQVRMNGDTLARYCGAKVEKKHKATKYIEKDGKYYVKVKSIAYEKTCQTYDIEVNHPDHNFETVAGVVSNSEEAQWEGNPDELLTSLFACIPDPPEGTEVYRESTAQGYGNTFQEDVFAAYCEGRYPYYERDGVVYAWKDPRSDWVLVFIPWFCVEKYTRLFRDDGERKRLEVELDKKVFDERNSRWVESEGKRLRAKFGLSLEQLNWRRYCIENDCRGSVDKFHQNYPSTVEEAFLSQGTNVFDKELCDEVEGQCSDPVFIGSVERVLGKLQLTRNRHGYFSIWEKPIEGESYFLTVDTAGGKKKRARVKGTTSEEPDRTNIDVWNHRTGNQVAQWNGHIHYGNIGNLIGMIGEFYFMGKACVELMNHGYTVVEDLKRLGYPQYHQKPDEPGWFQTHGKKAKMVDESYRMVRDADLKINCRETVSEMRTFVEDPPGIFEAASGSKDDRVTTVGLASQMMFLIPREYLGGAEKKGGRKRKEGFSNWSRHPKANVGRPVGVSISI